MVSIALDACLICLRLQWIGSGKNRRGPTSTSAPLPTVTPAPTFVNPYGPKPHARAHQRVMKSSSLQRARVKPPNETKVPKEERVSEFSTLKRAAGERKWNSIQAAFDTQRQATNSNVV